MEWFFLFFGILLCGIGVWAIGATLSCKKEIKGIYIKSNVYSGGKGQESYAPVFRYFFEGKEYEQQSLQGFSRKYVEKQFNYYEEYSIFINEKNPKTFVVRQKVQIMTYIMVAIGVVFMGISFIEF